MTNFTLKAVPFSWNDNLSEVALEDFSMIQKDLPYCTCQSIGMALAKLELLEKQGAKVEEQKEVQRMKQFECTKCNSKEIFIEEKGSQKGLYCADCGKWIKWLNKDDYRLAKRQIELQKGGAE